MYSVLGLEVLTGVEVAIDVDGMVTDRVQADAFGSRCRVCNEYASLRIVVEALDLGLPSVLVLFATGLDAAVDVFSA